MMPAEGGYYHWVKKAFGPFAGFVAGWNNWIVSWLDVTIYAVLATYYLGYFFPSIAAMVCSLEGWRFRQRCFVVGCDW